MASFLRVSLTRLGIYFSDDVLISFREWLHSYKLRYIQVCKLGMCSSHLFQRVASFLHEQERFDRYHSGNTVLISFREWLHSYLADRYQLWRTPVNSSHLFQRVASFLLAKGRLVSPCTWKCSHLFQRVASFLHIIKQINISLIRLGSHLFQRVASFLLS